jgi:small-conductance mechanosensitive channel
MMDVLRLAAAAEAATGVALILVPQVVVGLLFGVTVDGAGVVVSRLAGMALLGLGVACWPAAGGQSDGRARAALSLYNALALVLLAVVAQEGTLRGPALWPAVAAHLVMTVLLVKSWVMPPRAAENGETEHRRRGESG